MRRGHLAYNWNLDGRLEPKRSNESSVTKIAALCADISLRSISKMARRGEVRILITLGCIDCRERTYNSSKNRRNDPQRLELKKFCPRCRTHTMHREVR